VGLGIEQIATLLLVAAIVAIVAQRLRMPYTVGLVFAGVAIALSPLSLAVPLTKKLIFTAFLPPLIFDAAIRIPAKELRRDLPVVLMLATVGVMLSGGPVAVGMHFLGGWGWAAALLFGALISATDPVSVIATLRQAGARGRLRLLAEAESLFNDGTAAVAFGIVLAAVRGEAVGPVAVAGSFLTTVVGGIACGGLVAGGALLLIGRTTDHLVEITVTSVAAYGSFLLAEHFHASGVLATLTAGLVIGNMGPLGAISPLRRGAADAPPWGREAVLSFWDYVAFLVNSLVFILIGMSEARLDLRAAVSAAGLAIALVLFGRAVSVYLCCGFFARSPHRVPRSHQHVLFWGGLRGALALALALGLPPSLPHREQVITVAFAVVAFAIVVQGLTMTPLLRRLGEIGGPPETGTEGRGADSS
jgi:CPA1 family monovalent cation:H+ antiporter